MHKVYGITCSKTGEEFKKSHDTVLHSLFKRSDGAWMNSKERQSLKNLI
jgi:hypothetical protein